MGALLRMFRRKDAETKKREQETAEKERKAGDRYGRLSKSQLKSWEGKYGSNRETTSGSSDDRTLYAPELDKVRSNGSGSSFLSGKQGPVDFLPKFDFVGSPAGGTANEPLVHTPPTPPIPWTAAKRATTLSSRPVLAPLQPSTTAPEWDRYLSSRTLSVAQHQAQSSRASRTLSMYSLSDPAALAAVGRTSSAPSAVQPSLSGDAHGGRIAHEELVADDDDIPLAVAAAVRTRSSPILPRPSTMYDLSASPSLTQQGNNSFPTLPRSHSRAASLSMPAILAQPVTPPLPPSTSFTGTSANLSSIGKRATLIDLTEPSLVDPYQQRNGRSGPVGGEERIVTGDRSRAGKKREEKLKSEGPKILDFEELENRHKKRMSQLQTTATDHLTTEAAKKRFQQQQQREAEQQRRKEAEAARRRSVSSNLNLVAGGTSMKSGRNPTVDDFGAFKANSTADPRRRSSTSMSGLSALLKFGSSSAIPTPPPAEACSSSSAFSPPLSSTRGRRQSTLALVQPPSTSTSSSSTPSGSSSSAAHPPIAPTPRTRPPRPTLAGTRRHSLGTLLEASYEASLVAASDEYGNDDLEPPARPFAFAPHGWSRGGREPGHEKRVEKVQEWRRRSSSEQSLSSSSAAAAAARKQGSSDDGGSRNASSSSVVSERTRVKGRGEFGVLQKEAVKGGAGATAKEEEGTKKKKKKHDWLAY